MEYVLWASGKNRGRGTFRVLKEEDNNNRYEISDNQVVGKGSGDGQIL
jgi:hypothetical protein